MGSALYTHMENFIPSKIFGIFYEIRTTKEYLLGNILQRYLSLFSDKATACDSL
jgi:hypothetical protein